MRCLILCLLGCLSLRAAEEGPTLRLQERLQQEAVDYVQAQALANAGHYVIRATKPPTLPRIHGANVRFEPSHISKREPTGCFFAVFRVIAEGRLVGSARVEMEGRWSGTLLKTTESLPRKTVPSESQLQEVPFEGNPPPAALTAFPSGYRLRANVPSGHTLTQADLEPIPLVNAGERVRLTLHSGCLTISADATARGPGSLGDKVRVELPTRKWIQVVVTGPGQASAEWGA